MLVAIIHSLDLLKQPQWHKKLIFLARILIHNQEKLSCS